MLAKGGVDLPPLHRPLRAQQFQNSALRFTRQSSCIT